MMGLQLQRQQSTYVFEPVFLLHIPTPPRRPPPPIKIVQKYADF